MKLKIGEKVAGSDLYYPNYKFKVEKGVSGFLLGDYEEVSTALKKVFLDLLSEAKIDKNNGEKMEKISQIVLETGFYEAAVIDGRLWKELVDDRYYNDKLLYGLLDDGKPMIKDPIYCVTSVSSLEFNQSNFVIEFDVLRKEDGWSATSK